MFASLAAARSRASFSWAFRRVSLAAVAWFIAMFALAGRSTAQIIPPITTALPNAEVWVHPTDGVNPTAADEELLYINDPSWVFKTCLYFNLQGLIVDDDAVPPGGPLSAELLRSNMQGEYR